MKDLVKISALSGLLLSTTVLAGPFNIDAGDNKQDYFAKASAYPDKSGNLFSLQMM